MTPPTTPNHSDGDGTHDESAPPPPPPQWQADPFGAGPDAGLLPDLPALPDLPGPPAAQPPAGPPQPPQSPSSSSPSSDPFPYAQQVPQAQPFPYAQEMPPTPPARDVTQTSQTPQSSGPEPFPYAQEIPAAPPTVAEPFPFAQEIPDKKPPAAEPFPWAQEIPGQTTPAPGALASGPPANATRVEGTRFDVPQQGEGTRLDIPQQNAPQFNEPWLNTQDAGKGKGKNPKKTKQPKQPKSGGGGGGRKALIFGGVGLAVVAIAGGGVFAVTQLRGGGGSDSPAGAKADDALFPLPANLPSDGRDQQLAGVAAVGTTVVAIGGESDAQDTRGMFLVSQNGGKSFTAATVRGPEDGSSGQGEAPKAVAGSAHGWVAIGSRQGGGGLVWTSGDGRSWQRRPDAVGEAFGPNARIRRLIATDSGFAAIGETSAKGDYSDAVPTVWLSGDGNAWEARRDLQQIGLGSRKGRVQLTEAAASGSAMLLEATVTPDNRKAAPFRLAWRSTDAGRSWSGSEIPAPKGSRGLMIGGGGAGFVAVRELKQGNRQFGQAFTSKDGSSWKQAGRLTPSGYRGTQRLLADGGGYAALVQRGNDLLIARSNDGGSWHDAGSLPVRPGQKVADAAAADGRTVVVGEQPGSGDVNGLLAGWDAGGAGDPLDLAKVPGAVRRDHTVVGVGAANGHAVAVGSTGGDAAAWTSSDGSAWKLAQGLGAAFTRPGAQRLTAVTGGTAGWLAVGSDQGHALVVTSSDGATWRAADTAAAFRGTGAAAPSTVAAAAGPAGYVVIGAEGPSAAAWFSKDLQGWERGRGSGHDGLAADRDTRWALDVAGGSFGYATVGGVRGKEGNRPAVWNSADGRQWRLEQLPLPGGVKEGHLTQVAAKGSTLVATGLAATPQGLGWLGYVSADGGKTWKPLPTPGGADQAVVTALTATPKGFAATAAVTRDGGVDVLSLTSADGSSWTAALQKGAGLGDEGDQRVTGLAPLGDKLLGVGRSVSGKGDLPVLWTRPVP
ncbi:hypothetical protein AB0L06_13095 [Spirillospora sp. NPDC052269]